jgi:hypothetical protein
MSSLCPDTDLRMRTVYCPHNSQWCDRGCEAKCHASEKARYKEIAAKFAEDKAKKVAKAAADLERSTDEGWMCEDPSYVMAIIAKQQEAEAKAKQLEAEAKAKQLEAEAKAKQLEAETKAK